MLWEKQNLQYVCMELRETFSHISTHFFYPYITLGIYFTPYKSKNDFAWYCLSNKWIYLTSTMPLGEFIRPDLPLYYVYLFSLKSAFVFFLLFVYFWFEWMYYFLSRFDGEWPSHVICQHVAFCHLALARFVGYLTPHSIQDSSTGYLTSYKRREKDCLTFSVHPDANG